MEETKKRNRQARNDGILILALLVVLAIAGACFFLLRGEGSTVTIKVDQRVVGVYPLSEDRVVDIPSETGHNRLVIQDGKASMESATCPDGICVAHYAIHRNGESIVCLPNKVVVTVTTDNAAEPDLVV